MTDSGAKVTSVDTVVLLFLTCATSIYNYMCRISFSLYALRLSIPRYKK